MTFGHRQPNDPILEELGLSPALFADSLGRQRRHMILHDLHGRGLCDPAVLGAMARVPRELFIDDDLRENAYEDSPLPIGLGQTISQPFIVGRMIALARIGPGDRVLEIGSGCGYATAVMAELGAHILGLEILGALADQARRRLAALDDENAEILERDGHEGLPEQAPFDAIVLWAAPESIPSALPEQLAEGGRLVAPVGAAQHQRIVRIVRRGDELKREELDPVRFVPLLHRPEP